MTVTDMQLYCFITASLLGCLLALSTTNAIPNTCNATKQLYHDAVCCPNTEGMTSVCVSKGLVENNAVTNQNYAVRLPSCEMTNDISHSSKFTTYTTHPTNSALTKSSSVSDFAYAVDIANLKDGDVCMELQTPTGTHLIRKVSKYSNDTRVDASIQFLHGMDFNKPLNQSEQAEFINALEVLTNATNGLNNRRSVTLQKARQNVKSSLSELKKQHAYSERQKLIVENPQNYTKNEVEKAEAYIHTGRMTTLTEIGVAGLIALQAFISVAYPPAGMVIWAIEAINVATLGGGCLYAYTKDINLFNYMPLF